MLEKGLIQIYTGDGKGKTTAAIGLAVRAAGHGNKVLIYQFLKPTCVETGERIALRFTAGRIDIKALETVWDMANSPNNTELISEMKDEISEALTEITEQAQEKIYDCIILDEIVFCLSKGLAKLEDIKKIIEKRNPSVEIVLTGRGVTKELIDMADLVTEMNNIKHPFDNGVKARRGIEF